MKENLLYLFTYLLKLAGNDFLPNRNCLLSCDWILFKRRSQLTDWLNNKLELGEHEESHLVGRGREEKGDCCLG